MIYLDNAATTQPYPEVIEAITPYLYESFGNAGTNYTIGRQAAEAIHTARKQVADLIGAKPEEIIFTSSGTEANNLALLGVAPYLENINKKQIITSVSEHDSILNTVKKMCIKDQFDAHYIDVDTNGCIKVDSLSKIATNNTGLVSLMYVNNEVGSINNIKEACKFCHNNNILFHTDCVQALSCVDIDVNDIDCDLLSISSHKIHGIKGVGALYIRNKEKLLSPLIIGGLEQEYGFRGGTQNVAGIVAFGKACEITNNNFKNIQNKVHELSNLFQAELMRNLTKYNLENTLHINGLGNGKILNLRFDTIDAQSLVLALDTNSIYISSGSACRSNELSPSRTLIGMGLSDEQAHSSIRISFSYLSSDADMVQAAKKIVDCVRMLKSL